MNQSNWSGLPFPAMPAEARVALLLAKYAVFGVVPLVIPSIMIDVPIPIEQWSVACDLIVLIVQVADDDAASIRLQRHVGRRGPALTATGR